MGIEQMRANKAARKKEMEELERLKKELLEEEEEQNGELPEGLTDEKQKVEVVFNRQMSFKSKEQVEMEAALAERARPLNVVDLEKMDKVQLEDRAKEYWKVIQSINGEKNELSKRMEEQDREIKDAVQRLAEVMAAKQAKKGVDMERLALGPGGKAS